MQKKKHDGYCTRILNHDGISALFCATFLEYIHIRSML